MGGTGRGGGEGRVGFWQLLERDLNPKARPTFGTVTP